MAATAWRELNAKLIEEILVRAGLSTLIGAFMSEKIDPTIISSMNDDDMVRLGVTTIGDRIRLRESAKQQVRTSNVSYYQGFGNPKIS